MDIKDAANIEEAMGIINSLVSLIYDLYPDEEYEELYSVKEKIAQAQNWCDKQTT
jgi:hypothetical protein